MDDSPTAWKKVTGNMFGKDNPQQILFLLLKQINT